MVIGHHPHVLQGVEKYNKKYIVYSMGNFCFGGNQNPSDKDTMIFRQTFSVRNGMVGTDDDYEIIPCSISSTSSYNDYCPTPLEGDGRGESGGEDTVVFPTGSETETWSLSSEESIPRAGLTHNG